MKIAVIGAGAIGNLVAGYLKQKEEEVCLVGRPDTVKAVNEHGLKISGVRGVFNISLRAFERLSLKPDLAILACKTQDIELVLKDSAALLKEAALVSVQNGVRAEEIIGRFIPKENIISSIVMFGSTYLEPAKVVHNFEGSWIIGKLDRPGPDRKLVDISMVLNKIFPVVISEDIKGMKYLKIFVNANNCLAAILGVSMQEAFSDFNISRISIAIWREGFDIVSTAGIKLVSLPGFPVENITKLTSLPPEEAAKIFSGIMSKLSKEPLYGSILQSIKRQRSSEIDYINGEFTALAKQYGIPAPLNSKLVEMVHQVEKNKKFFTKEELMTATKELLDSNGGYPLS